MNSYMESVVLCFGFLSWPCCGPRSRFVPNHDFILSGCLAVTPKSFASQRRLCLSQQMAEPCRTVRVSGLPTDIEDDRLKDKLFIHFLRTRNGGGEIESVTIVKATLVSALITFEDSGGQ